MREIKFRAWDNHHKIMLPKNMYGVRGDGERIWFGQMGEYHITSPMDYELMQYTGMIDKNGKEIYEGDIVLIPSSLSKIVADHGLGPGFKVYEKIPPNKGIVEWVNGSFRINKPHNISKNYYGVIDYVTNTMVHEMEVIGNIYENPELLEEGEK